MTSIHLIFLHGFDNLLHYYWNRINTVFVPQVISAVHGVYQALLSLKNIPTLEAAYKMVLGEIACALSSLTLALKTSGTAPAPNSSVCSSIQHPAFASLTLPLENAEFTLIFNLSTLTTIGNTKNSLIGVSVCFFSCCVQYQITFQVLICFSYKLFIYPYFRLLQLLFYYSDSQVTIKFHFANNVRCDYFIYIYAYVYIFKNWTW